MEWNFVYVCVFGGGGGLFYFEEFRADVCFIKWIFVKWS